MRGSWAHSWPKPMPRFLWQSGTREILGYLYAALEPLSWKELRDEAGFIHDVVVDERGRRTGLAGALIQHATEWLRSRGASRVMLWTAEQNTDAQRLFERVGFRRTMVEMTMEIRRDVASDPPSSISK